ncbi:hypothetical protein D3C73_1097850 [compost metagenome]
MRLRISMKRNARSVNSTSGCSYMTHMILAASIGEPPPTARIRSGWKALASAVALRTTASVGSALTSKKTSTSRPRSLRMRIVSLTLPFSNRKRSVTIRQRFLSFRSSSAKGRLPRRK